MLSKFMNDKFEESCGDFVLCKPTDLKTFKTQNSPLSKQDVCKKKGNNVTSEQECNGTADVKNENSCDPGETDPSLPFNQHINTVKHEEFDSDYLIANGVLHTSEKEPTHNVDEKPMNIVEHSLTKRQHCPTTFPYSLFKLHSQTCNNSMGNECSNILEEKKVVTCQFCQGIFPDSLLQQHEQTCTKRKMHKCSKCEKCFRVQSKLLIHQQVHSSERPHPCEICSKPFKFRSGLSRHKRREHSNGCTTEHEKQNGTLQKDITLQLGSFEDCVDIKDSQFCCCESSCKEEHFMRRNDFETSKTKMEQETVRFKQKNANLGNCCEPVGQTIVTETEEYQDGSIRRWPKTFEIETNDLKENTSMVCTRNVQNPESNFEVTQKLAHVPNGYLPDVKHSPCRRTSCSGKVYECEYCSSVFEKPSKLLVHQRIHSEEKLFTCEICQNTFKHKGSLTRHVKEQHYCQGRRASSVAVDGKQRRMRERPGPLGTIRNVDHCLSGEYDSIEHTVVKGSCSSDEEQNNLSMVFDGRRESEISLSYRDESNFRNPDDSLVKGNGKEKDLKQERNSPSMIFRKRQDGDGLSLLDEVSLRNVGNTDELLVSKSEIGLECEDCSEGNDASFQNKFSIESHDNTYDDRVRKTDNKKCSQDNFDVDENIRPAKHDLHCGEINLENMGKGVEVNRPSEMPEEPKLYQCTVCLKIFPRPSALRKHKKLHNSTLSFSCKICGHYFKYKGSLTRHVKEQHYGQGRKSCSVVVDGQEENILENSSPLEKVVFEDGVGSSWGKGGSTRSWKKKDYGQIGVEGSMTLDEGTRKETDFQNGGWHSEDRSENCNNTEDSQSCERLAREGGKFEGNQEGKILCLADKVGFQNIGGGKECLVRQRYAFKYIENNGDKPSLGKRPNDNQTMISDGKKVVCFGSDNHTEVCLEEGNERHHSLLGDKQENEEASGEGSLANINKTGASREICSETFQCEEENFAENSMPRSGKQKVYECWECPQVFPIPSALRKHKVIHSDDMPFSCQTCGRYFKYKGSLRRHIKEQHYGLGRKSLSSVFGEMGRYKQIGLSPLEGIDNSLDINESLKRKDGSGRDLNERDRSQGQNDEEKNEGKLDQEDCSSAEQTSFGYCDTLRENENRGSGENVQEIVEASDSGQSDQSVIFDVMQRNEMTPPSELEENDLENSDSLGDTDIPSMIYRKRQEVEEVVALREGDGQKESGTWNHEENNVEVSENFPHLRSNFESEGRNLNIKTETSEFCVETLDVDEHTFEVNLGPFETPNKCSFPATQSHLREKYERGKVYECPECQKAFAKSSHLRKHIQSHSDVMSFSCQICEHRFKYKDSLSRHIKEQHYGQGRKGLRIEMAGKLEKDEGDKEKLIFLQTKEDFQNKVGSSIATAGEESAVKEALEESIVEDERSRNFEVNPEIQNHNLEKDSNNRNGDISPEPSGEERNLSNLGVEKPKICSDNREKASTEFSCKLCGRYCKYKSSLSRHYREQHLGKGRKADKSSFEDRNTKHDYPDRGQNDDIKKSDLGNRFVDVKENGSEIESSFEQVLRDDNVAVTHEDNFQPSHFELLNLKAKKVHKCPDCSKTFWSSSELKEHAYKHTDIRSFVCTLCEKAFKFRSGLVRHNRKEHKKKGLTDFVSEIVKDIKNYTSRGNNSRNGCLMPEKRVSVFEKGNSGSNERLSELGDEVEESHSPPENVNSVLNVVDQIPNVVTAKTTCQKPPSQKKPGSYNCNKCDAVFKQLCDFLTHQRIHK